jgi:hypothetical protein
MTEAEWLACTNLPEMMYELYERNRYSLRQERLFSCACCRRIWHLLTDERSRVAVQVAEHYIDGLASWDELETAWRASQGFGGFAAGAADCASSPERVLGSNAIDVASYASNAAFYADPRASKAKADRDRAMLAEQAAQADLLRDIAGNPFRATPTADPAWLTWRDGTVRRLAETIYNERRFADLPVLADALEEAGCTDAEILDHCRGGGEHVLGCWMVDLVLAKG